MKNQPSNTENPQSHPHAPSAPSATMQIHANTMQNLADAPLTPEQAIQIYTEVTQTRDLINAQNPKFYQHLEERIQLEDQLLLEIQAGNLTESLSIYNRLARLIILDNEGGLGFLYVKSYSYSLNVLCRRAAHKTGVPITILHAAALRHVSLINDAISRDVLFEENIRMISEYTELIRRLSICQYGPIVNKVQEYIFNNLNRDFSLKELADCCRLTPSYLSAVFKRETGCSVMSFAASRKIYYACTLLTDTHMQIQEIARHCGYRDVSYFTRAFRRETGVTPTEYRIHGSRPEQPSKPEQPSNPE